MESGFLINHTFQRISARIGNFIMYTLGPFFAETSSQSCSFVTFVLNSSLEFLALKGHQKH